MQPAAQHDTCVPNGLAQVRFLQSYGWEVNEQPCEMVQVVIPETFGDVYENYNEIQKQQGFDLSRFRGKQVSRCSYEVLNYPGQKEYIRANLLIYNQEVIGGDICSIYAENGFMHGFSLPERFVKTPQQQQISWSEQVIVRESYPTAQEKSDPEK